MFGFANIVSRCRRCRTPAERRKYDVERKSRRLFSSDMRRTQKCNTASDGSSVDRIFRNMIEKANCNGDCIINVGKGVFRPIPSDPVDEAAFHEYIAKDLHRARAIQLKRLCMKQTYDSWSRCSEVSK